MAATLLGCDAPSGAGSDPGGDSAIGDTADSGAVELPPLPVCPDADFTAQTVWDPANPWWYLRSMEADTFGTWIALLQAAEATGCPAETTEGDTTVMTGDCTAADVEFRGSWRSKSDDAVDALDFVLDGVSATVSLDDLPQDLAASGVFYRERRWQDGGIAAIEERSEGYRSVHRGAGLDGEFLFEGLELLQDTEQFVARGAVTVDWEYGVGRYCPVVELHAAPDCPEEPDGYYAIQGAETWLMVANGSSECDGCVAVYRDGAWQETFCELPSMLR